MQKIERKFFYFILFLIVAIVAVAIYIVVFTKGVDRNSYVELLEGKAIVNDTIDLKLNEKHKLEKGDVVKTIGEDSLVIIEWGDGSVTRLGGNTSIIIEDTFVSDDKNVLNISFKLLNGKTWSNVISFIREDSYFTQKFMDMEAAVRGTVFNVDLDNNYLYVEEHEVSLTKPSGEVLQVKEKKPIDLKSFNLIEFSKFLMEVVDSKFRELNEALDKKLFSKLEADMQKSMQEAIALIGDLSNASYEELLSVRRDLNFLSGKGQKVYDDIILTIENGLLEKSKSLGDQIQWKEALGISVERYKEKYNINIDINNIKNWISNNVGNSINEALNTINNSLPEGFLDKLKSAFIDTLTDFKKIFKF